jgi:hypothetical protein
MYSVFFCIVQQARKILQAATACSDFVPARLQNSIFHQSLNGRPVTQDRKPSSVANLLPTFAAEKHGALPRLQ